MRKICFFFGMVLASLSLCGQIVAWQFGSPASAGDELSYTATSNHPNLETTTLTRGSGINASALARSFSANNFIVGGTRANAITNNQFFAFSIKATTGFSVSFSTLNIRLRRSATGPNVYAWRYSLDGNSFTDIGSDISFASTADGVDQAQINLSAISALQNVTGSTTITFRLYAWGASAVAGSFAIGRYGAGITTNSLAIGGLVVANSSLPVNLVSFSGYCEGNKNVLKWTTVSEQNNLGFWLECLSNGINYSVLAFVHSLAVDGNSNKLLNYSFNDSNLAGNKQYYRLRQVDIDGHEKLSRVVLIKAAKPSIFSPGGLFPNPAKNQVNLVLTTPVSDQLTLLIMDQNGKLLKQQAGGVGAGSSTISVDISSLAPGIYILKVSFSSNGETMVSKFIKQ